MNNDWVTQQLIRERALDVERRPHPRVAKPRRGSRLRRLLP